MKMFLNGTPTNLQPGDIVTAYFLEQSSNVSFSRGKSKLYRGKRINSIDTLTFKTGKSKDIEQMLELIAWSAGLKIKRLRNHGIFVWQFIQQG